jgi:hypothetical protein
MRPFVGIPAYGSALQMSESQSTEAEGESPEFTAKRARKTTLLDCFFSLAQDSQGKDAFRCHVLVEDPTLFIGGVRHSSLLKCGVDSGSNRRRHLRTWHLTLLTALEELEAKAGSLGAARDLLTNHNTKIEEMQSRKSIETHFKAMSKLSAPLIKARAAYAMHLCKTGNSFRSAECPALAMTFDSIGKSARQAIGTRKQLSVMMHMLERHYNKKLREYIQTQQVTSVSFTCDGWTDIARNAYIGLTAHFLNQEFKLEHRLLEVFPFSESQTAINLTAHFEGALERHFPGNTLVHCFTTDNGANYVAAMKRLVNEDRLPCFIHTLQLCIRGATSLEPFCSTIQTVKELSKGIRDGRIKRALAQHNINHTIPKNVATRWSSDFRMVEGFLDLAPALGQLRSSESFLSPSSDLTLFLKEVTPSLASSCRLFIQVFDLFNKYVVMGQSMSELIIVQIPEWVKSLNDHVAMLLTIHESDASLSNALRTLAASLQEKFEWVSNNFTAITYACALHPNYSELTFASEAVKAQVQSNLVNALTLLDPTITAADVAPMIPSLQARLRSSKGLHKDATKAALQFWSTIPPLYAVFVNLARMAFSAQPTSVPSECAFSNSGSLKTSERPQLPPSQVNRMTVLRVNVVDEDLATFLEEFCLFLKEQKSVDNIESLDMLTISDDSFDEDDD